MAAPQPDATEAQRLRNITECNLCFEAFRDPRILPCFHTFCLSCISQAGPKASERLGEKMPCPLCRKEFPIPSSGFEGLQQNLFVQRMTEARKLLDRTSGQIPCDTCNDETIDESDVVAITVRYCLECNLNLCEQCCAHHRRSRLTKEHTLREGASLMNSKDAEEALDSRICRKHTDEEMKLYCKTCLEVLCPMCFIENHQGHERLSVAEAGDDFRRQIQVSIIDIDECTLKATAKKELIERQIDRVTKRTERLEKEVLKRRDDLKELVDEHARLLLEKLETKVSENILETEIQDDDYERHLQCLESYKDYIYLFVAHATNGEICSSIYDLKMRATELSKENDATVQRLLKLTHISFTAKTLDTFSNLVENIIGSMKDSDHEEPELISEGSTTDESREIVDVVQKKPAQHATDKKTFVSTANAVMPLMTKQKNRPIWGLAILHNELFIAKGESSQVEVYDAQSHTFKRQWKINDLSDPQDIVSCASKKCLLIMNWDDGYNPTMILKVDRNGKVLKSWSMKIGGGKLSITPESTVIITAYDKNKLYEYSLDGELIKELKLPAADFSHPQHAVKLANGSFIVCCGGANDRMHRVCLVDKRGNVLNSFGGESGSDNQSLNRPLHLTVDGDGYIFVADWGNRRVLLLDSNLQFRRELVTRKAGLKHPGRIFLDDSKHQLFLANNAYGSGSGHVLIFQLCH